MFFSSSPTCDDCPEEEIDVLTLPFPAWPSHRPFPVLSKIDAACCALSPPPAIPKGSATFNVQQSEKTQLLRFQLCTPVLLCGNSRTFGFLLGAREREARLPTAASWGRTWNFPWHVLTFSALALSSCGGRGDGKPLLKTPAIKLKLSALQPGGDCSPGGSWGGGWPGSCEAGGCWQQEWGWEQSLEHNAAFQPYMLLGICGQAQAGRSSVSREKHHRGLEGTAGGGSWPAHAAAPRREGGAPPGSHSCPSRPCPRGAKHFPSSPGKLVSQNRQGLSAPLRSDTHQQWDEGPHTHPWPRPRWHLSPSREKRGLSIEFGAA